MTSEQTTYRTYLGELARSRGLPGAEELAQAAAAQSDARFSAAEILEDPPGRFGRAIDAVLSLDEQEKDRLARAWRSTFLAPKS
jgi:hypothetical protein